MSFPWTGPEFSGIVLPPPSTDRGHIAIFRNDSRRRSLIRRTSIVEIAGILVKIEIAELYPSLVVADRCEKTTLVSGYAPDNGESSLSLATANPTPVGAQIRPDASGFLKLTAAGIEEDFGQDLSDVEKVNLIATQGPTAGGALGALASKPAWKNKPTSCGNSAMTRVFRRSLPR